MKRSIKDKVVLITGASSGIGEALAREYARKGARLVLAARRVDRLERLKREIAATGGEALAVGCDVARDGEIEKTVAAALQSYGRLDVVIANAGFGIVGRVDSLSLEDYRRQFETNVFGVLRTIYGSLPELEKSRGKLAIMGSVSGHISFPNTSPYSMSKFAVRALAESLREELRPAGVSVTLISPGFVDSEIRMVDNQGRLHQENPDPVPRWIRMPTDRAARQMVRGIEQGRREIVITFHGKVVASLNRHLPGFFNLVVRIGMRGRTEPQEK